MAMAAVRGETGPIRVLIVDDLPVLRGVIRQACEAAPGLEVVGEGGEGDDLVETCRRLDADVLVLSLGLGDLDRLEAVRRLRESSPTKVLVLTGRTDDQAVFECIRAGAHGYLGRTAGIQLIRGAIEAVAAGGRVFTPEQERGAIVALGRLTRHAREASDVTGSLTRRELEILRFLARGFSMKQVALRLGVSPRTVESHITKLYRKLGARTRVQALSRAASLGLVDLGSIG